MYFISMGWKLGTNLNKKYAYYFEIIIMTLEGLINLILYRTV